MWFGCPKMTSGQIRQYKFVSPLELSCYHRFDFQNDFLPFSFSNQSLFIPKSRLISHLTSHISPFTFHLSHLINVFLKSITLTTLLAVACSFSACTGNKTATTEKAAAIHLTKADNGKTVQCKMNESFDITFNECRGCASIWQVVGETPGLEQSPKTYSNPSCTNCTGGNQDVTFHFKAKTAGKTTLTFSYFNEETTFFIEAKQAFDC